MNGILLIETSYINMGRKYETYCMKYETYCLNDYLNETVIV